MIKRILAGFLVLLFITSQGICAEQWREDGSEETVVGTESPSDIDTLIYDNIVAPNERLLSNYKSGCVIQYASAATLTVTVGEIMLSNSAGTARLMQKNTSAVTVTWAMIDTGAEAASTTYYLWAYQATTSDTDFDVCISTSSTAPSGKTYYARIGSFYNNASSNITNITNDRGWDTGENYDSGWFAVAVGTAYAKTHSLGTTKLLITLYYADDSSGTNMFQVGFVNVRSDGTNIMATAVPKLITTTSVTIQTGASYVAVSLTATGEADMKSSGYLRVIALALE